jgi:hypothetical protein
LARQRLGKLRNHEQLKTDWTRRRVKRSKLRIKWQKSLKNSWDGQEEWQLQSAKLCSRPPDTLHSSSEQLASSQDDHSNLPCEMSRHLRDIRKPYRRIIAFGKLLSIHIRAFVVHRLCRERTIRQALPRTSPLSSPHFGITSLALRRQGNGRMQDHVEELCLSTLGLQTVHREIDGLG